MDDIKEKKDIVPEARKKLNSNPYKKINWKDSELKEVLREMNIYAFIKANDLPTEKGGKFGWKDHLFLFDIYDDWSPVQAICKSSQVGFCLSCDTKILTNDLKWIKIDDIKIGQEILSVNENVSNHYRRKMKKGIIEDKRYVYEDSYRLEMDNGKLLEATSEHRFLTELRSGKGCGLWRKVKDIIIGDKIRYICNVWERDMEDSWFGGIIDGEGSFRVRKEGSAELVITQDKDSIVGKKIKEYLDKHKYSYRESFKKSGFNGKKNICRWSITKMDEILEIFGKCRPVRFINKDWWENKGIPNNGWGTVIRIEYLGKKKMVDIQTSGKTFIAEGFISHNSTMTILKAIYAARYKRMNIIYTLPSQTDASEFVSSKVNKIIMLSPFLKGLVKDKDTMYLKQVGDSVIFFKGTMSGKQKDEKSQSSTGIMISSDLNIHDEADRSDQAIIEMYESRLDFSKYKGRWYFSNPTVPNVGSHRLFLESDQKHFFHRCSRCNNYITLEWNEYCVDRERRCYLCPRCGRALREEDRRKGWWVKKYPEKTGVSGYWINQMISPWKSCKDLLAKELSTSKAHFYNFCLGLPYLGSEIAITREVLINNLVGGSTSDLKKGEVAIGVDNGIMKHYVVGNAKGIYLVGKTTNWDEIENLRNKWDATMVIDALPYPKIPYEWTKKYQKKVYANYYKKDKDDTTVIRFGRKEKRGMVYSDRNKLFDEVINLIYDGKIKYHFSENKLTDTGYIKHWESMYMGEQETQMGIKTMSWMSTNNDDHFCLSRDTMIMSDKGEKRIDEIMAGDMVDTRDGLKEVERSWETKRQARTITAYLDNGRYIRGTREHKIMTDKGWKEMGDLEINDKIECYQKKYLIRESFLEGIPKAKEGQKGHIIRPMENISSKASRDCMWRYGKIISAIFQKVSSYIIKTEIRLTIALIIWLALIGNFIKANMPRKDGKMIFLGKEDWKTLIEKENYPIFGERAKREKNGIASMRIERWYWKAQDHLSALSAKEGAIQRAGMGENSVHQDAVIVGWHENYGKESVWNLTVKDKHEYYANGILVSNCHATNYYYIALARLVVGTGGFLKSTNFLRSDGIEDMIGSKRPRIEEHSITNEKANIEYIFGKSDNDKNDIAKW